MEKIYATVLTYNRQELLRQCLDAIRLQSTSIDTVLVIDNGSTDGTIDMLKNDYPWVEIARLATNLGASGGFNFATRIAMAAGATHVWLMDDDVIADCDALQHLLDGFNHLAAAGCPAAFIVSSAYAPNGELTNVPVLAEGRNSLGYPDWPRWLHQALVPVRRATFVSILIPAHTFQTFGYPLGSMFIWGEDSEFTLRISNIIPGYLCGASKVVHVRANPGILDVRRENTALRRGWHRYRVRNHFYNLKTHRSASAAVRYAFQMLGDVVRLFLEGRTRDAAIIARGIVEGVFFQPNEAPFLTDISVCDMDFVSPCLQQKISCFSAIDVDRKMVCHPHLEG